MASAEQLSLPMCLDGLPISILGLADTTLARLHEQTIDAIEEVARIALVSPASLRNELAVLIETDLREHLHPYSIHCCPLLPDAEDNRAQLIIESDLFHFTASVISTYSPRCTCTYTWASVDMLACVPFHKPSQHQHRSPSRTINEATPTTYHVPSPVRWTIPAAERSSPSPKPGHQIPTPDTSSQWLNSRPRSSEQVLDQTSRPTIPPEMADLSIDMLGLSNRTRNALIRHGEIQTISQLANASDEALLTIYSFGQTSLREVKVALANLQPVSLSVSSQQGVLETMFPALQKSGHLPLSAVHLSNRIFNALWQAQVNSLTDLFKLSEADLLKIRNIGQGGITEIIQVFEQITPEQLEQTAADLQERGTRPETISIETVGFHADTIRRLQACKIGSLDELCHFTLDQLHKLRCTILNTSEITATLKAYGLSLGLPKTPNQNGMKSAHPITDSGLSVQAIIDHLLGQLNNREQQILKLRYGLDGIEPRTLGAVGQTMGCTRERVRQIEIKALRILRSYYNQVVIQPLVSRLRERLEQSQGVLAIQAAQDALYRPGDDVTIQPDRLLGFLLRLVDGIQRVKSLPILILTTSPYDAQTQHVGAVCNRLKHVIAQALAPLPVKDVVSRFASDKKGKTIYAYISDEFLVACLKAHPDIVLDDQNMCSLKQWATRRTDDIVIVLREHGKPLHYSEIAERVNQRLPDDQQTTAHNIHAQIGRMTDIFIRVGHGVFGLAEWGLVQDNNIANAAYRILTEAGGALHIEELTDRVLETWHVRRTSVKAAIDLDDRFEQVGRNLYWLRNTPQMSTEGDAAQKPSFDQMFGSLLLQHQQDLERDRISAEQTNDLEEIRRLDTDLLR